MPSNNPYHTNSPTPFGSVMLGRDFRGEKYRFGFNGKEKDNGIKGNGNSYDFGARIFDPRVGRFLSLDPHAKDYPSLSEYVYVANNPIMYIDPDGKDIVVPNVADREPILKMINSKALGLYAFDKSGKLYQVRSTGDASRYSKYYAERLNDAIKDNNTIEIRIGEVVDLPKIKTDGTINKKEALIKNYDVDKRAGGGVTFGLEGTDQAVVISGNENAKLKDTKGNKLEDKPADILAHELVGHAIPKTVGTDTGNAVKNENKVRQEVKKEGQTTASPLRKSAPTHYE